LPMYPGLTQEELEYVVDCLGRTLGADIQRDSP